VEILLFFCAVRSDVQDERRMKDEGEGDDRSGMGVDDSSADHPA
jgi:hypothetical protein